ncbi:MAG: GerMN domain-containing protein [Synergistaceae bacterium]|nr:GerMN domain-containing protein [Synergistaceae bacterium]
MPTVRKISSTLDEKETSRRTDPQRHAVPRRRQAQQQLLQQRKAASRTRPRDSVQEKESAPLLLKLLSWLGIVLLCFVIGYMGTSWLMEFLNQKWLLKPENRIENQEDLTEFQEAEHEKTSRLLLEAGTDIKQVSLNLHYVTEDTIGEARKNFVSSTKEDNIRSAVEEVLELSDVPNANRIKLLHVFRNGDTAFLDMPGQFASALEDMGERKSQLLLTGLVRTLQENFAPVKQIRFLLDSKVPESGGIVNLAAVWKMPPKS